MINIYISDATCQLWSRSWERAWVGVYLTNFLVAGRRCIYVLCTYEYMLPKMNLKFTTAPNVKTFSCATRCEIHHRQLFRNQRQMIICWTKFVLILGLLLQFLNSVYDIPRSWRLNSFFKMHLFSPALQSDLPFAAVIEGCHMYNKKAFRFLLI
jgi:hypothetical protein